MGTYDFDGEVFLREARIDSQAGNTEDADGKHPTPSQARATNRRQLLRHDRKMTQHTR